MPLEKIRERLETLCEVRSAADGRLNRTLEREYVDLCHREMVALDGLSGRPRTPGA